MNYRYFFKKVSKILIHIRNLIENYLSTWVCVLLFLVTMLFVNFLCKVINIKQYLWSFWCLSCLGFRGLCVFMLVLIHVHIILLSQWFYNETRDKNISLWLICHMVWWYHITWAYVWVLFDWYMFTQKNK